MTANSPKAFFLSATFHGAVIAVLFLASYAMNRPAPPMPATFELVAGEGDNYGAHVAPKLGVPNGLKVEVPALPTPPPPQPEPVQAEPVKVEPAPPPPAPKPPPQPKQQPAQSTAATEAPPTPNFKKQIVRSVIRAESKAKQQVAKERAAEAKRLAEEEKKRQLSKAEYDRTHKSASGKESPAKIARLDPEGIAKGVLEGSSENKVGGAGGKALRSDSDDVLAAYFAMFKQRVRDRFEPPPGLSDALKGTFEFRSHPDGSISGARVVKSSGSSEFDQAVLEAIRRVTMPPRPDRKSEPVQFDFTMRDKNEG